VTRDQREHLLRAASQIAEESDVIVLGSQAILGSYPDTWLPREVIGSIEADLCFFDDVDEGKADKVDGAIGELSPFHESFGIYAQGVSISTAVLGPGWRDRVVVYENANTAPGRGLCLEPHDLVASKLAAGRDKDFEFSAALLRVKLIDPAVLRGRIDALPVVDAVKERLGVWLTGYS
jgi:hypothetical protein